jgi:hypothetical protein
LGHLLTSCGAHLFRRSLPVARSLHLLIPRRLQGLLLLLLLPLHPSLLRSRVALHGSLIPRLLLLGLLRPLLPLLCLLLVAGLLLLRLHSVSTHAHVTLSQLASHLALLELLLLLGVTLTEALFRGLLLPAPLSLLPLLLGLSEVPFPALLGHRLTGERPVTGDGAAHALSELLLLRPLLLLEVVPLEAVLPLEERLTRLTRLLLCWLRRRPELLLLRVVCRPQLLLILLVLRVLLRVVLRVEVGGVCHSYTLCTGLGSSPPPLG